MRTLLTYVLAAFAASVCVALIVSGRHHVELLAGIIDGRYRAIASLNPAIEMAFRTVGYLVGIGIPTLIATRFIKAERMFSTIWRAVATSIMLVGFGAGLAYVGFALWSGQNAVTALLTSWTYWAELAVAGTAWGLVFWLREPKADPVGQAA